MDNRDKIAAAAVVLMAVAALAVAIITTTGGFRTGVDGQGGWIYEYQSLIAGVLAVMAAGATIAVLMRQSRIMRDTVDVATVAMLKSEAGELMEELAACTRIIDEVHSASNLPLITAMTQESYGSDGSRRAFWEAWFGQLGRYERELKDDFNRHALGGVYTEQLIDVRRRVNAALETLISALAGVLYSDGGLPSDLRSLIMSPDEDGWGVRVGRPARDVEDACRDWRGALWTAIAERRARAALNDRGRDRPRQAQQ